MVTIIWLVLSVGIAPTSEWLLVGHNSSVIPIVIL